MAYFTANTLTAQTTCPCSMPPMLPGLTGDSAALARLGGGFSPLESLSSMPVMQNSAQQVMQLEMQLLSLIAGLMSGAPGGGSPTNAASAGLNGGTAAQNSLNAPPPQPGGKSSFNVASFNVLGASHTAAGGNKPGMRSGVERTQGAVNALKKNNVGIAGLQEFQGPQQAAFKKLAPGYGMAGEQDNAIVWDKSKFRLVEKRSVSIPYFEGHKREMPVVQLEDKSTGKRMWVVNVHNPADTKDHPHNAANRAKAVNIEQALARQLQATGLPVIFTGDFNERNTVDNQMSQVGMDSAAPNGARSSIDYVFGSGVTFSNYVNDRSPVASGTSDHPMIVSQATI